MTSKTKLTPQQEIGILKGFALFSMASLHQNGFLTDDQHKHWVEQLKCIGVTKYTIREYECKDEEVKVEEDKKVF